MENPTSPKRWFEELSEAIDKLTENLPATTKLNSFLNVEEYPEWVLQVAKVLFQQTTPGFTFVELKQVTPETVGLWLGQNCANLYALAERFDVPESEMKERLERADKLVIKLEKHKQLPVVKNALDSLERTGDVLSGYAEQLPGFEKLVHHAFKEALDQPCHSEAADFFRGFAQGISKKGLTSQGLAKATDATPVYLKMFYNWQEVDRLKSVAALYLYLQKIGLTKQQLGHIERLKKLCYRVKYRPGKRGRPRRADK